MARSKGSHTATVTPAWVIDLKGTGSRPKPLTNVADPPGFAAGGSSKGKSSKHVTIAPPTEAETDDLKIKKAWEVALAPAKQLPMNMVMMYMSGNSLQIFSIMMTAMLFMNPVKAISQLSNTFSKFDGETTRQRLLVVKLAYVALQILTIGFGIWKVNAMGLLPTTRSDWLAWEGAPFPVETSVSNFS